MKHLPLLALLFLSTSIAAQRVEDLGQTTLSKWNIGAANYSGITALGNGRYAVVSDKEPADGFFVFRITQDTITGEVTNVQLEGFRGNPSPTVDKNGYSVRDCEGIAYFPAGTTFSTVTASKTGSVFISGEGDQAILEYDLTGRPTGRRLSIPAIFSLQNIVPNYGFESLTYNATTHRFWTTTESTLPRDGYAASASHPSAQNLLRLVCFDDNLQPVAQYPYRMDYGRAEKFGRIYAYGVSELTALDDGTLLVLEREVNVPKNYYGAEVVCKLFQVKPSEGWQIDSSTELSHLDPNRFLNKQLLTTFTTSLTLFHQNFANYEGMCLGARLLDGRRTLLLINDSQGGYGRDPVHLKDYLRVLILP